MRPSLLCFGLLTLTLPLPSLPASASPAASAAAGDITLRIGLRKDFSHVQALLLSSDGPFAIQNSQTGRPLLHGTPGLVYKITAAPDGLLVARDEDGGGAGALDQNTPINAAAGGSELLKIALAPAGPGPGPRIEWHHYRGTFTIQKTKDATLSVVNLVPLEQYLYGVVPAEIGAGSPPEAMKAQAVAARTYALKNRGKCAAEGYDLDDTSRCEGYDGWDGETAASDAAVDATRGLVLTWHGALIDAPFSTDCGGMTACDPSGDCPWLQAVRDAPTPKGPDYAADDKYHTWTLTDTPAQLQAALGRDARTHVNAFQSLTLDGFDASGRITTATVTGTDGTARTVTGPQLRQILGYDVLRSTLVTLTVLPDGDYQFTGKGWGHGLGMSQDGAVAMASSPYDKNYKDILSHYYVGTTLTPVAEAGVGLADPATEAQAASRPQPGA